MIAQLPTGASEDFTAGRARLRRIPRGKEKMG
jgi:hypothetical protein